MKYQIIFFIGTLFSLSASADIRYETKPATVQAALSAQLRVIAHSPVAPDEDVTSQFIFSYPNSDRKLSLFFMGSRTIVYGNVVGILPLLITKASDSTVSFSSTIQVTVGEVGKISLDSGNNQSVSINQVSLPMAVKVVDRMGNPVPAYKINWTTLSGSASPSTSFSISGPDGIASMTFSSGSIPGSQVIKAETASPVSGLGKFEFNETVKPNPGTAYKLAFAIQPPTSATRGLPFTPQAKVVVKDVNESIVTDGSISLTLRAYKNYSCTTPVTGNLISTPTNLLTTVGEVKLSLQYDAAETIYLKASANGLISTCSSYIKVNQESLGPTKLVFIQQPNSGKQNRPLFIAPSVAIEDNLNKIIVPPVATTSITLSAYTDNLCKTASSFSLTGGTTLSASSGVAYFNNVSYAGSGDIYLKAVSGNLTSSCSKLIPILASVQQVSGPNFMGSLDTSFGLNGVADLNDHGNNFYNLYNISINGSNIVAQTQSRLTSGTYLIKFNQDGSTALNPIKMTENGSIVGAFGTDIEPRLTAVQSDGKILFYGALPSESVNYQGASIGPHLGLGRAKADGTLDLSFGTNGSVVFSDPTENRMRPCLISVKGNYVYVVGELLEVGKIFVAKFSLSDGSATYPGGLVSFSGFGYNSMKMDISDTGSVTLAYWDQSFTGVTVSKVLTTGVVSTSAVTTISSDYDIGGLFVAGNGNVFVFDSFQSIIKLNAVLTQDMSYVSPPGLLGSGEMGTVMVKASLNNAILGVGLGHLSAFNTTTAFDTTIKFIMIDSDGKLDKTFKQKTATIPAMTGAEDVSYSLTSSSYMSDAGEFMLWGKQQIKVVSGATIFHFVISRFK